MRTPAIPFIAASLLAASLFDACPEAPHDGPDEGFARPDGEVDTAGFETAEVSTAPPDASDVESGEAPDIEVTAAECTPGAAGAPGDPRCDDDNPCTDDTCRPSGVCAHTPNIALCDDGDACTSFDRCNGGACRGSAIDCDDQSPCTSDACVDGDCRHEPVAGACDDGSSCTSGDHCVDGVCQGAAVQCPGDGPCAHASCDPRTGCALASIADGIDCDDGNACTSDTACDDGECRGALLACSDENPCTDDYCDPATGCSHRPNRAACDDGDRCTVGDVCADGACAGAAVADCCAGDGACDDGDACTADRCEGATCTHTPLACDDGDTCTRDGCEAGGCVHTAWAALPEEGQLVDDFEGALDAWTFASDNPLVGWRQDDTWAASGTHSLYCGDADELGYDHGATRATATIRVLVPPSEPELHVVVRADVEDRGSCVYDALVITIDGVEIGRACGSDEADHGWSLAGYEGREVALGIAFDTVDDRANGGLGTWLDRLRITAKPCN